MWIIVSRRRLGRLGRFGRRLRRRVARSLWPAVLMLALGLVVWGYHRDNQTLAVQASLSGVSGRVIVIDPGHGGPDPGAVGGQGVLEKQVVLAVAQHLRDTIAAAGGQAILTRTTDVDLSDQAVPGEATRSRAELAARVALVTQHKADVFLSIHANKLGKGTPWRGAQVFWDPRGVAGGEMLAAALQAELQVGTSTTRLHRPIEQFVLARAPVPAATVEVGFLSNPGEELQLAKPGYQKQLAAVIAQGLARYYAGG